MPDRKRDGGSSSESESTPSPRLRRSARKPDLKRYAVQVIQEKPRKPEGRCEICVRESSQDGRNSKHRKTQQHCTHSPRRRTRCQQAHDAIVPHLGTPRPKSKGANRIPHIIVHDQSWNVPMRPCKASVTPEPLIVPFQSLWDGVGGSPKRRDLSPSSASANTDDLLENDAEAMELQTQIARTQRERAEFGQRLQELEVKMRLVRAEMNDLRGKQQDREEQVTKYGRRHWQ